jgi:hypothetical protein
VAKYEAQIKMVVEVEADNDNDADKLIYYEFADRLDDLSADKRFKTCVFIEQLDKIEEQ